MIWSAEKRRHQFADTNFDDAIWHSAADLVRDPLRYYENNVVGSMNLVRAMQDTNVSKLVFSSSATVYGDPIFLPLTEDHPKSPHSPYGRTKLVVEGMLGDLATATGSLRVAILRYFNPVGCHESGLIGEDPLGVPGNLMPFISQVGRRPASVPERLRYDYDTPDGTGVRDYVHVMDPAAGHVRALEKLETQPVITVNLGTGRGSSVLDMVSAFRKASGKDIPLVFAPRRDGDVSSYYACTGIWRNGFLVGVPPATWWICVPIAGIGNEEIQPVIATILLTWRQTTKSSCAR